VSAGFPSQRRASLSARNVETHSRKVRPHSPFSQSLTKCRARCDSAQPTARSVGNGWRAFYPTMGTATATVSNESTSLRQTVISVQVPGGSGEHCPVRSTFFAPAGSASSRLIGSARVGRVLLIVAALDRRRSEGDSD
jgi:hypothetical protein